MREQHLRIGILPRAFLLYFGSGPRCFYTSVWATSSNPTRRARDQACIGRAVSYTLACIPPGSLCTSEFVHSPDTSWKDTITHQPETGPYGGSGPALPCCPPLSIASKILFLDFGDTEGHFLARLSASSCAPDHLKQDLIPPPSAAHELHEHLEGAQSLARQHQAQAQSRQRAETPNSRLRRLTKRLKHPTRN